MESRLRQPHLRVGEGGEDARLQRRLLEALFPHLSLFLILLLSLISLSLSLSSLLNLKRIHSSANKQTNKQTTTTTTTTTVTKQQQQQQQQHFDPLQWRPSVRIPDAFDEFRRCRGGVAFRHFARRLFPFGGAGFAFVAGVFHQRHHPSTQMRKMQKSRHGLLAQGT